MALTMTLLGSAGLPALYRHNRLCFPTPGAAEQGRKTVFGPGPGRAFESRPRPSRFRAQAGSRKAACSCIAAFSTLTGLL